MKRTAIFLTLAILLGGCVVWPWGGRGGDERGHERGGEGHDRGSEGHDRGGENR